jgi:hypothetical protein
MVAGDRRQEGGAGNHGGSATWSQCWNRGANRLQGRRLALSCGRTELRIYGVTDGCRRSRRPGCLLRGGAARVTAEWTGFDVCADERLSFSAVAEANHAAKRAPPVVMADRVWCAGCHMSDALLAGPLATSRRSTSAAAWSTMPSIPAMPHVYGRARSRRADLQQVPCAALSSVS